MNMFEDIWTEATNAAIVAHNDCVPVGMTVGQASGLFGNAIIPGTEEYVADGVCGYAWIQVKPARGPFVKWMKQNKLGDTGVYGGWTISPSDFDRSLGRTLSMQRKEAAMRAACAVLKKHFPESKIWVTSRMD